MSQQISAAEQARRQEALRQIRHSTEMEGGRTSDAERAEQDRWARGEITIEEGIAAAKARVQTAADATATLTARD